GMTLAVEEKMRSERFKTELITNVSHDIKTPLTSIINYVDLLKSEPLESEKAREYVEVIDRHSTRLKKLTEDLIEASKASTGVLNVDRSPCEIGVLLTQVTGEYAEKLAGCDLDLVTTQPDHPVTVLADGRLLWRILDNLLSNACKYGQPGTRVYVSLTVQNKNALIVVRNISRNPLNISGDELMERFVRGDRSRSTDGSGLGLSIARSLSELQGAEFAIDIDGDLFKAILTFPLFSNSSMQKSADARVYNAVE
ncbi:MAG: HAMP domain-containing histidine kinase, partial [Clostridiaceae bacterium]|nr:HAMP domain-containing histidine kinase [Clostridiaceae bacterium]